MSIEIRDVSKNFGDFRALKDVSLNIDSGELVALLGPSGCGKTTLLRIIAGLETADRGSVLLDGEDASDTHVRERQVGFVFQHYALFRHMARARCSTRLRIFSPSPCPWLCGDTVSAAISAVFDSGYG